MTAPSHSPQCALGEAAGAGTSPSLPPPGRWRLALLGLLLVCAGLPADSQGYDLWLSNNQTGEPTFWANDQATLNLQLGCRSEAEGGDLPAPYGPCWDDAAQKAAEEWNAAGSGFRFVIADPPDPPPDVCDRNDGVTTVAWTNAFCGRSWSPALASVQRRRTKADGELIEADVLFNSNYKWTIDSVSARSVPGPFDFYRIALHEFGHVLGLSHSNFYNRHTDPIMTAGVPSRTALHADDKNGAVALYGNDPGGVHEPPPALTANTDPRRPRIMIVGDAVSFPLSATTGTPPLTYRLLGPQATCQGSDPAMAIACPHDGTGTVVDPDWPAGLTFDASTRTLSGTLTALGPGPVLRRAYDSGPFTRHTDPYTETTYTYLVTDNADPTRPARPGRPYG